MYSFWDVGRFKSDGFSKKMIRDKIMYPTSLCEGIVSNVNRIIIVFLMKQAFFFPYSFVSRKKNSVVFSVITDICVTRGITINDSVFSLNLPFICDMLGKIQVHGFRT
jgi:hypothetical protein